MSEEIKENIKQIIIVKRVLRILIKELDENISLCLPVDSLLKKLKGERISYRKIRPYNFSIDDIVDWIGYCFNVFSYSFNNWFS